MLGVGCSAQHQFSFDLPAFCFLPHGKFEQEEGLEIETSILIFQI